jgi:chemotaxis protein histidine kinase CheA
MAQIIHHPKASNKMQSDTPQDAKTAIQRAEAAVAALSPSFQSWLVEEVEALVEACQKAIDEKFSLESRQAIFLSAHTLKGQAATLGYPQIAQLAASLCRLLNYWGADKMYPALASEHVLTISQVAEKDPESARAAGEMVQNLTGKTAELIGEPLSWD